MAITTIGILLVIAGIALIVLGNAKQGDAKVGIGGAIGPFVIGFGNDRS